MSNLNEIPREFQVLSTQLELRIRCSNHVWGWCSIFLLLFFLPFFFLFIGHIWILVRGLYEILNLRVWQGIHSFSYDTGNPWRIFEFFFAFFLLGVASWFGIWSILGITEFYAAHDSLTISYKLLGMFRKISLLTKDIDYFNQFLNESSEGKSWHLEIVTNRRISNKNQSFPAWISKDRVTRINYKTIHIYAHANPSLSEWLGNVLADFYGSRFQSISQPNNPVAHRPNQDSR